MLARTKRLLVFCFSACLLAAGLTSLQARPLAADQNDQRLDALFEELRTSGTFEEAHPVEGRHAGVILWPDIMGIRPAFRMMGFHIVNLFFINIYMEGVADRYN